VESYSFTRACETYSISMLIFTLIYFIACDGFGALTKCCRKKKHNTEEVNNLIPEEEAKNSEKVVEKDTNGANKNNIIDVEIK
jgi:hypothetical protein